MRKGLLLVFGIAVGFCAVLLAGYLRHSDVRAQAIHLDAGIAPTAQPQEKGHVEFDPEPAAIAANKPATVLLHFRIAPGFHINSHTPNSGLLIPTKIAIADMPGAEVIAVNFPPGQSYSFAADPGTKLDVYTGQLLLLAHVKAKPGAHVLTGALRYQACDTAACYPPKTLKVEQPFTAR